MKLRRRLKAEVERTALRMREELGITAPSPIDVEMLAEHVGVALAPISALARAWARRAGNSSPRILERLGVHYREPRCRATRRLQRRALEGPHGSQCDTSCPT